MYPLSQSHTSSSADQNFWPENSVGLSLVFFLEACALISVFYELWDQKTPAGSVPVALTAEALPDAVFILSDVITGTRSSHLRYWPVS